MKTCKKCGAGADYRGHQCKSCYNVWRAEYRAKIAKLQNDLKTPCIRCGEDDTTCIDYHHIDPSTKKYAVANCRTEKSMLVEIKKCVCICSNCHRKLHAGKWELSPELHLNWYFLLWVAIPNVRYFRFKLVIYSVRFWFMLWCTTTAQKQPQEPSKNNNQKRVSFFHIKISLLYISSVSGINYN